MEFVFEVRSHRAEALRLELAELLRQRTEHSSRERCPRLWAITDRITEQYPARPRKRWYSILLIVLGLLVSVPGLLDPMKLAAPLVVGLAAVLYGIWRLFPSHKPGKVQFQQAADQLLEQVSELQDRQFRIAFTEDGMTITNLVTETSLAVPYENFECVVEGKSLFLLVYNQRATVLVKEDLLTGTPEDFCTLLRPRLRLL